MDSKDIPAPAPSRSPKHTLLVVISGLLAVLIVFIGGNFLLPESGRPECEAIDGERGQGVIFTNPTVAKENPLLYCACLSEAARRTSSSWLLAALLFGGIGALCTLFGGALGPEPDATPGTIRAQRGVLLAGVGALLVTLAIYCNARASVGSSAAANAHAALALADSDEMFGKCIKIKSDWISSRTESAALIFDPSQQNPKSSLTPNTNQ